MRLAALAVVALATVAAAALARDGSGVRPAEARIERVSARLAPRAAADGSWSARWRLCWAPVRGADGYVVTVASSEGVDPRPRRVVAPCWSVTVATGVPRRRDVTGQAALIAPQLSVRVAAALPGGTTGPATRELAVGVPYP